MMHFPTYITVTLTLRTILCFNNCNQAGGFEYNLKNVTFKVERERQERESLRHQEMRDIEEREKRREMELKRERLAEVRSTGGGNDREEEGVSPPPSKRTHLDSDESPEPVLSSPAVLAAVAATNIKITSQG